MSADTQVDPVLGSKVNDSEGSSVGKVSAKMIDPVVDSPDWVVVAAGLLGRKQYLCPLRGAEDVDGELRLGWSKDTITSAPEASDDGVFAEELEQKAYEHYELDWAEYDPDRQYGDRQIDFASDDAPVTHGEDDAIRDPESGTRRDAEDMRLPEHRQGIRPHPDEDPEVESTGEITPPTRAGGADDPSSTEKEAKGG